MSKRLLVLSILLVSFVRVAQGQIPPPCPDNTFPPSDDCSSTCIYCNFNGMMSQTAGYTQGSAPGFCGTIENEQWLGFIAGASGATFTATPTGCANGNGIQIALYTSCSSAPIACNGGSSGGGNNPVNITAALTPGVNYFLLIDGYAGDQCSFTITVTPPSAVQAPNVGPVSPLSGPTTICPGATVTYSIPPVTGAGGYIWNGPPGTLINGQAPPVELTAPGGNTVQVTVGPTGGQICVQAVNSCFQGATVCRTFTVQPIPPTNLPPAIVCAEDAPYTTPWGQEVYSSGNYQATLESYLGCDSIVKQTVTIKAPIIRNLPPQTVCAGGCITICGEEYCEGGNFSKICQSYQGCDSLVNFSVLVLDPVAEILGGGTLSCVTSSIQLSSTPSPGTKIWRVLPAGTAVGSGNTYTVTQPGTYTLTVTASAGGTFCVKADTITINGNTTPPTAAATGGTLGCADTTVQLNATTNAPIPFYVWSNGQTIPNPIVSQPGNYIVTITNGQNGCTATATATVTGNTIPPQASASGDTLTCATTSVIITASSPDPNAIFSWTGPNNFTANTASTTANAQGVYTVTVVDPDNGCASTATATVALNNAPPGATTSVSSPISCTNPSVFISATTAASNPSYSWTGPGGFTSSLPTSSVLLAGDYTVVVTSGANGCTSSSTIAVTGDTDPPSIAATGGTVSCAIPSINLGSSTNATNPTYSWSGPNGFTSPAANPSVTAPGTYTVVVTSASNNCTASTTALVDGDFAAPNVSATGGTISCSATSTTINATSLTPNTTFSWDGPGNFSSTQPLNVVSNTGVYTVTATGPNGCTATATADVVPDANVPNVSANGGTLSCAVTSITLDGGSTTPGVTLQWSGPNGFSSPLEDPVITNPGTYVLTATNTSNGCSAQANAVVDLDDAQPGASANGGIVTCANPTLALGGSSPSNNVSWSWTGPGGFTSAEQNPNVGVPGNYTLVVTNLGNGCTSSAGTEVLADQTAPQLSASADILTCALTSLPVVTSSTLPATYQWTGPNFSSTEQSPTVIEPGDYTVIATSANGCKDTLTITVNQDIAAPGADATGSVLDCNNPVNSIGATSPATGATFAWTGPNNFTAATSGAFVSEAGDYIVTVTGTNGCTSTATATVSQDIEAPVIQGQPNDILTCATTATVIETAITNGTSPIQTIAWTGPNNFTASVEDPQVTEPGIYTVTATSANGCATVQFINVEQDIAAPDASALGGTLTCAITSLNVTGTSITPGAIFAWTGPNNFTATGANPMITASGNYVLTVTGPNGCTNTATAVVALDVAPPGATAVSSNNLDCDETTAQLQANSPTGTVSYQWSGPNASGTTQVIAINQPGTYSVQITGPNGCTSTASVDVTQDITEPGASASGDTLNCISGTATLGGSSPTAGVTWTWTGPGIFTSDQQNPTTTSPGTYTLTVTGPNGCTSTATTQVAQNTNSPVVSLSGGGTLTCAVTSINLAATISTPGATGVWTLPGGGTSTATSINATVPGNYIHVTTAVNGCLTTNSVQIPQDIQAPQNVTAQGGTLNCTNPTIPLAGNSSTPGVTYTWTTPGGVVINQQNPPVNEAGIYTLVVTNPQNGCTNSATAQVDLDPTTPDIAVTTQTLTCSLPQVTLQATSLTQGVVYSWTGPGITPATQTQEDPLISLPGNYTVTVTNPTNGCTASFTIAVAQDIATPGASAQGGILSCTVTSLTLQGNSPTAGVTYQWSGPGFNSGQQNPSVNQTGSYVLTVTGANGCTSTATAVVSPDVNAPQISANGGTVTCAVTTVQLIATSNVPVTWQWSGPGITPANANVQNPVVSSPGNYSVIATATNGCSISTGATVLADTQGPTLSLGTPDQLDCNTTQVNLSVQAGGPGTFTYAWGTQNGNILSGANTAIPIASQAGDYTVTVTNTLNGCTTLGTVTVPVDPATPSGVAFVAQDVSCYGYTDGTLVINDVVGGTPPFRYRFNNAPTFTNGTIFTRLEPGSYPLEVLDANGCEFQTTIEIGEPAEMTVDLGPDDTVRLGQTILLTLDTTAIVNVDPLRIGQILVDPAWLLDSALCAGCPELKLFNSIRYRITVIDTNGCKSSDERYILVDKTRDVYFPNAINPLSNENNIFRPYCGAEVERIERFVVYDRWGGLIYEANDFLPGDPNVGWDGTVRNQRGVPAVFVYYAEIRFIDGEVIQYKGDVTLYR